MKKRRRFDLAIEKTIRSELTILRHAFTKITGHEPSKVMISKAPGMYKLRSIYYREIYNNFPLSTVTIALMLKKDANAVQRAIKGTEDNELIYRIREEFYKRRAVFYRRKTKSFQSVD